MRCALVLAIGERHTYSWQQPTAHQLLAILKDVIKKNLIQE